MATGGDDRLSELSDDLLRRILYFVPSKEAARTSKLSRRWGSLWRTSGAVNLAVRVHGYEDLRYGGSDDSQTQYEEPKEAFFSKRDDFVRGAKAALAAAEAPITRLTLRVESEDRDSDDTISQFLCRSRDWHTKVDVVGAVVSHQAARHVEELRIAAVDVSYRSFYLESENHRYTGIYGLASLPSSDTLRVLDLTRCKCNMTTAAFPLPRLATLRLRHSSVQPKVLQAMLDAAPELTTVQLDYVIFTLPPDHKPDQLYWAVLRLSFQAVTTLVLSSCGMDIKRSQYRGVKSNWAIEIHAPRLQSFKYKGLIRGFVLRPAAPSVAQVDLHFVEDRDAKETIRELFWQFVHNFASARTVKLRVDNDLLDIAAIGEAKSAMLPRCAFPSVERLELEGAFSSVECRFMERRMYCPEGEEGSEERLELERMHSAAWWRCPCSTPVAIANLLDCCPVLGEFMLRLNVVAALPVKNSRYGQELLKRKNRSDYSKSIDRFVRRQKSMTAISMEDSIFGDKYSYDDVPDIPGLSDRSFDCLQRTLTRVGLQFRLDNNSISSCFGLRLIKFFANHARVLQEMCVDTGNRRLDEHRNFNVETQMALAPIPISATATSIQHKNLAESSSEFSRISSATLDSTIDLAKSTGGFMVLPLRRKERMDWKSSSLEN